MSHVADNSKTVGVNISIDPLVLEKIMIMTEECSTEMSGMGRIVTKDGRLHITSIFVPEQYGSSAYTEISAKEMHTVIQQSRGQEGALCFHWHSHANMGVFMSGTDKENLREIGANGLAVALVTNKKREYYLSCFIKGDGFRPDVELYDLEFVDSSSDNALREEIKKLVSEKVKNVRDIKPLHDSGSIPALSSTIKERNPRALLWDDDYDGFAKYVELTFEDYVLENWDELFSRWAKTHAPELFAKGTDFAGLEEIDNFEQWMEDHGKQTLNKPFKKWKKEQEYTRNLYRSKYCSGSVNERPMAGII